MTLTDSSLASGNCDRYGRSLSSRAVTSNRSTPYSRPRIVSGSGSNGSTGNSSPPQPPSAPQTPTSMQSSSLCSTAPVSSGFTSSYSQSGFMPVEPTTSATVFSYPGSWQANTNYWSSSTVPGPMPVNTARVLSEYKTPIKVIQFTNIKFSILQLHIALLHQQTMAHPHILHHHLVIPSII